MWTHTQESTEWGVEHGHNVDKYGGSEWSGVDQVHCMEGKYL